MKIDLALLGLVGLFGLFGCLSGAIKQLSHWIGLAAGYFGMKPLSAALTPLVASRLGAPQVLVAAGLSTVLFSLISAVAGLASGWILGAVVGQREKSLGDRLGGFLLGGGKAAGALFVLLSGLLFFEAPLIKALGREPAELKDSAAIGFVRRHNLFSSLRLPELDRMRSLTDIAKNPRALMALASEPRFQELAKERRFQALMNDPGLATALRSGDVNALLQDAKIKELLDDPAVMKLLDDPRIKEQLSAKPGRD